MKVTIIDYGMGNLFSVQRAVEICGVTNITLAQIALFFQEWERLRTGCKV